MGNPLFGRELLRMLAGNDVDPAAIGRFVSARLRRQPREVRRVARAGAVLGDDTALAPIAEQAGV
jgi:hypothetical protein